MWIVHNYQPSKASQFFCPQNHRAELKFEREDVEKGGGPDATLAFPTKLL